MASNDAETRLAFQEAIGVDIDLVSRGLAGANATRDQLLRHIVLYMAPRFYDHYTHKPLTHILADPAYHFTLQEVIRVFHGENVRVKKGPGKPNDRRVHIRAVSTNVNRYGYLDDHRTWHLLSLFPKNDERPSEHAHHGAALDTQWRVFAGPPTQ